MAGGREVNTGEPECRAISREVMCVSFMIRRQDTAWVGEGIVASSSSGNGTRAPAGRRLGDPVEDGRREGLGPRASMPDVAGIVPATRGLIAAPWTPASLSLLPAKERVKTDRRAS
jgi:hypothetical protein